MTDQRVDHQAHSIKVKTSKLGLLPVSSEPKGPICILTILRKSALKILAMFTVEFTGENMVKFTSSIHAL